MGNLAPYFSALFEGDAPAGDYYAIYATIGALLVICWTACCVYFFLEYGRTDEKKPTRPKTRKEFAASTMSEVSSTFSEDEALLSADAPISDDDLLRTFRKVLSSGVNMIQHGASGPAVQIHLSLRRNVLYWSGGRTVNSAREIPIGSIMFIDIGKNTTGFTSGHSAKDVEEDRCFSLVTSGQSLDLEATSKMEREAMAQGFSMLMATVSSAAEV